jgi:hypothetical protein
MAVPPSPSSPPRAAGGVLIALFVMVGAIGGVALGQPTIGFLVGLAVGIALAVGVWLIDRR